MVDRRHSANKSHFGNGRIYGIRNIVKLEIEKDFLSKFSERPKRIRTVGGMKLKTDLYPAYEFGCGPCPIISLAEVCGIEGYTEPIASLGDEIVSSPRS